MKIFLKKKLTEDKAIKNIRGGNFQDPLLEFLNKILINLKKRREMKRKKKGTLKMPKE